MTASAHDDTPAPASDVIAAEMNGERLLWRDGQVRRLDPVASLVWACLDGRSSIADIARDLAGGFGAPLDRVEADVARLCRELSGNGFLAAPPSAGGPAAPRTRRSVPTRSGADVRAGRTSPKEAVAPPRRPADDTALDRLSFAHRTGRLLALEHDFAVRSTDVTVGRYVEDRFRAFAAPGPAASLYSIVDGGVDGPGRWSVYADGTGVAAVAVAEQAVRYLFWHVHRHAVRSARHHLLVHAAAVVTSDGRAVALPGPMNAGKSTLAAGLVLAGYSYLSDELAAVDLATGWIDPYPRPLKVARGAWDVVPRLRPEPVDPGDPVPPDMWHVDVSALRPGAIGRRAPLGYVVLPRYHPGEPTRLEPISTAEAVEELHHHALNRAAHGAAGFRTLVAAVSSARCARLTSGSIDGALEAVSALVGDQPGGICVDRGYR